MSEFSSDGEPPPTPPETPPAPSDLSASFDAAAKEVCAPVEAPSEALPPQGGQSEGDTNGWNGLPPEQIDALVNAWLFGEPAPVAATVETSSPAVLVDASTDKQVADRPSPDSPSSGAETASPPVEYESVRDALLSNVDNEKLASHANRLYREGATYGDGGAAAALIHYKDTGELIGNSTHEMKVEQHKGGLDKLLDHGALSVTDREIAKELREDLEIAIAHPATCDSTTSSSGTDTTTSGDTSGRVGSASAAPAFVDSEPELVEADGQLAGRGSLPTAGAMEATSSVSPTETAATLPGAEVTEALAPIGDKDAEVVKRLSESGGLEREVEQRLGVSGPEIQQAASVPDSAELVREVRLTSDADMHADEAQNRIRLEDAAAQAAAKAQTQLAFEADAQQQGELMVAKARDDAQFAQRTAADEQAFTEKTQADLKSFEERKALEGQAIEQRHLEEEAFNEKQIAEQKVFEEAKTAQDAVLADRTAAEQMHFEESKAADEQAYERRQTADRQFREEEAARQKVLDEIKAAEDQIFARRLAEEVPVRPQFTSPESNNGPRPTQSR